MKDNPDKQKRSKDVNKSTVQTLLLVSSDACYHYLLIILIENTACTATTNGSNGDNNETTNKQTKSKKEKEIKK